MRAWLVSLLAAAVCACAAAPPAGAGAGAGIQMGGDAPAPWGYDDLCKREPEKVECGGSR